MSNESNEYDSDRELAEAIQRSFRERKEFEDNREKYPFHLTRMINWPQKEIIEYGVTDIPMKFGDAAWPSEWDCRIKVTEDLPAPKALELARTMIRLLNKAYGKEVES